MATKEFQYGAFIEVRDHALGMDEWVELRHNYDPDTYARAFTVHIYALIHSMATRADGEISRAWMIEAAPFPEGDAVIGIDALVEVGLWTPTVGSRGKRLKVKDFGRWGVKADKIQETRERRSQENAKAYDKSKVKDHANEVADNRNGTESTVQRPQETSNSPRGASLLLPLEKALQMGNGAKHPDTACAGCGKGLGFRHGISSTTGKPYARWSCPDSKQKSDPHTCAWYPDTDLQRAGLQATEASQRGSVTPPVTQHASGPEGYEYGAPPTPDESCGDCGSRLHSGGRLNESGQRLDTWECTNGDCSRVGYYVLG